MKYLLVFLLLLPISISLGEIKNAASTGKKPPAPEGCISYFSPLWEGHDNFWGFNNKLFAVICTSDKYIYGYNVDIYRERTFSILINPNGELFLNNVKNQDGFVVRYDYVTYFWLGDSFVNYGNPDDWIFRPAGYYHSEYCLENR